MKTVLKLPLLLAVMLLSACTTNPFATAQTATADNKPETIALATFAMFVIAEEAAADITEMPSTPQSVKDSLGRADRLASPAAESLRDTSGIVVNLRAAIAAGKGGSENLPAAINAVNAAITDAGPKLQRFTDAYNEAKGAKP